MTTAQKVFLVLCKSHPRFARVQYGVLIEDILAVCSSKTSAQAILDAEVEKYHEIFTGYRIYNQEPPKIWVIEEKVIDAAMQGEKE